jgi:hypothetical protein
MIATLRVRKVQAFLATGQIAAAESARRESGFVDGLANDDKVVAGALQSVIWWHEAANRPLERPPDDRDEAGRPSRFSEWKYRRVVSVLNKMLDRSSFHKYRMDIDHLKGGRDPAEARAYVAEIRAYVCAKAASHDVALHSSTSDEPERSPQRALRLGLQDYAGWLDQARIEGSDPGDIASSWQRARAIAVARYYLRCAEKLPAGDPSWDSAQWLVDLATAEVEAATPASPAGPSRTRP